MKFSVLVSFTERFPFLSSGGMFSSRLDMLEVTDGVETAAHVISSAYLGSIVKGFEGGGVLFVLRTGGFPV